MLMKMCSFCLFYIIIQKKWLSKPLRTLIHSYISITLSMHQEKWLLIRKPFNIFDILFHFFSDSTANHMHKIFVEYRPINIFVLLVVLFVMTSRQQYFSLQYDAQWLYFFKKNISDKLWLLALDANAIWCFRDCCVLCLHWGWKNILIYNIHLWYCTINQIRFQCLV